MVNTNMLLAICGLTVLPTTIMGNPLLDQLARKFSMLGTMLYSQVQNTTMTSGDISKRIQQYGCYCFRDAINSGVLFGNGEPVSPQDELCRNLMRCRKCMEMEFPGECDAAQEKYLYSIDANTNEIICNQDQDSCRVDKCECDKHFAVELGKMWTDASFDEMYWLNPKNVLRRNTKNLEVFDAATNCVKSDVNKKNPIDACCGLPGQKQPYSYERQECCDDTKLVSIGQCLI